MHEDARPGFAAPREREMSRHFIGWVAIGVALAASAIATAADAPTPASLGRKIFFDPSLSASGQMACSTCHDPAHAHAQTNDLAVQLGGPLLDTAGTRAV